MLLPVSEIYLLSVVIDHYYKILIHTVGNFLSTCLLQSGIDVSQMHALRNTANRVKSIGVQSLAQLMALVELLNTSLLQEKTLLILEGVQLILIAQKVASAFFFSR